MMDMTRMSTWMMVGMKLYQLLLLGIAASIKYLRP